MIRSPWAHWSALALLGCVAAGVLAFQLVTDPAPNFIGKEARSLSDLAGVELAYDGRPSEQPGKVVAQNPAAGTLVPEDVRFLITVAGYEPVIFKDPTGDSLTRAKTRLTDLGLTIGDIGYSVSETATAGTVLSFAVESRGYLQPGDAVNLVVAKRPLIKVPRVVGLTVEQADDLLSDTGLRARVTGRSPFGLVLSQSPAAGETIEKTGQVIMTAVEVQPKPSTWGELFNTEIGDLIYVKVEKGPSSRIRSGEKSWDGVVHGDGLSLVVHEDFRVWTPMPFATGLVKYGDVVSLRVDSASGATIGATLEEVWH